MNAAHPPSFKSCWQRAILDSDLPSTTRLILWAISIHSMDEDGGHCFPSIEDIMKGTGLTKKHVIRHLNLADEAGWLERRQWGKGRGYRRWNYQAILPQATLHDDLVSLGHQEPDDLVSLGHHKPCRDITMERESNHARGYPREAETAASAFATAPALSVSEQEKNRMTKLTDAVIEAAQKTVRQRGVREDLSDAALSHSIEKCRAQKGYCEMTEAAWIETLVHWVGKERIPNGAASRCETASPGSPTPSPEETARQNAAYEARMVAAEAQHQQRLAGYRVAAQHGAAPHAAEDPVQPVDPVRALHALAAKVRMGTTATPASPAQRTFGPMGALPARRPPLTAERRDALNQVLREMQKAGCSAADLTQIYQGVHDASEDAWPTVIAQARQRLVVPGQAVA